MTTRVKLLVAAGLLLLAACAAPSPVSSPTRAPASPTASAGVGRPDPAVTPGAILTRSAADVCKAGWASAHRRSLSLAQERHLMIIYRIIGPVAEWDHLIALELGGGNGMTNIWPQTSAADRARKDRLENSLHSQVCSGKLQLVKAQEEIVHFWDFW